MYLRRGSKSLNSDSAGFPRYSLLKRSKAETNQLNFPFFRQIAGLTLASLIFTAIMIKIWPCIKRCYRISGRCCSCCYDNCKKCGNCCWAEAEEVGGCCWMGSAKCFYCSKHCCRFICKISFLLYIYFACLSVCLFLSNERQNG